MSGDEARGPRGRLWVYGVAFVLMLAAGVVLVLAARDFLRSLVPLWLSVALSAGAIVAAVVAVVLPRRR